MSNEGCVVVPFDRGRELGEEALYVGIGSIGLASDEFGSKFGIGSLSASCNRS